MFAQILTLLTLTFVSHPGTFECDGNQVGGCYHARDHVVEVANYSYDPQYSAYVRWHETCHAIDYQLLRTQDLEKIRKGLGAKAYDQEIFATACGNLAYNGGRYNVTFRTYGYKGQAAQQRFIQKYLKTVLKREKHR